MLRLIEISRTVKESQGEEAPRTGDEVDGEDPADETFCLVWEGEASEEEAEQTLAPVVVEETELVYYFMHVALREKHDYPEKQVVQVQNGLVDWRGVNCCEAKESYKNKTESSTYEHELCDIEQGLLPLLFLVVLHGAYRKSTAKLILIILIHWDPHNDSWWVLILSRNIALGDFFSVIPFSTFRTILRMLHYININSLIN